MSRIGKLPIEIDKNTKIDLKKDSITVSGPKGELSMDLNSLVSVTLEESSIKVTPINNEKESRSMWGTTRTLVANMVEGVTNGFTKDLEFNGVGYKASVSGSVLNLSLGYSHPIAYELPKGITAKVTKNTISVQGVSKELVGFVAAKVRSFRKPEPYKGKGIKYSTEIIIRKAGKSGAKK
jgi:large subunit ribosomal protein L6